MNQQEFGLAPTWNDRFLELISTWRMFAVAAQQSLINEA